MHRIPSQVSKRKRSKCTLSLEMWLNFIILTTFLSYSFNQGDVHESFQKQKFKFKIKISVLENKYDPNHG